MPSPPPCQSTVRTRSSLVGLLEEAQAVDEPTLHFIRPNDEESRPRHLSGRAMRTPTCIRATVLTPSGYGPQFRRWHPNDRPRRWHQSHLSFGPARQCSRLSCARASHGWRCESSALPDRRSRMHVETNLKASAFGQAKPRRTERGRPKTATPPNSPPVS